MIGTAGLLLVVYWLGLAVALLLVAARVWRPKEGPSDV